MLWDPNAVTPHLDNLASQGSIRTSPLSIPPVWPISDKFLDRAVSGQSGVRDNRVCCEMLCLEVTTLPQLFRQHGYDVVRVEIVPL